jgi:hypothetical protein
MNIKGISLMHPEKLDRDEIKRQLAIVEEQVAKGEKTGSEARVKVGAASMTIKEARKYLGLPVGPIPYANK